MSEASPPTIPSMKPDWSGRDATGRRGRVDRELAGKIRAGTYTVDVSAVAEAILRRIRLESCPRAAADDQTAHADASACERSI